MYNLGIAENWEESLKNVVIFIGLFERDNENKFTAEKMV